MTLNTKVIDAEMAYTGSELRPHFLLEKFGMKGSSLVSFIGKCSVSTDELVDWEDRLNRDHISAQSMLHFLGEFFGPSLQEGVWIQRLMVAILRERLESRGVTVRRAGDDLFVEDRKLTVSIVTASPVSTLFHLGVNVDPTGAPVAAVGLRELGISPQELASDFLESFRVESQSIEWACAKVRPVL